MKQIQEDISKKLKADIKAKMSGFQQTAVVTRSESDPEKILERIQILFLRIRSNLKEQRNVFLPPDQLRIIDTYKQLAKLTLNLDKVDTLYEQVMAVQEHFTVIRIPEVVLTPLVISNYLTTSNKVHVHGITNW
ncbi:hypothetical protein CANARDRAFT_123106 [[Candida] arabinofermentans NRRL YB-2248]|uniref:Uncharacterized protein n=1 Tax=[Candida] arabinofermentans NRRL YB-2248 TaxID=983967 RepID=A0A1E4ST14_9ASCO|nr:hypothetical protein CANARDRAFT_123106 [[Candida] arabinofermentans NRRL YB-2248]